MIPRGFRYANDMPTRCPLCKSGALALTRRDLVFQGKILGTEVYRCSACRESLLDSAQIEALRAAVRREGLASTDAEVELVIERVMMQAS